MHQVKAKKIKLALSLLVVGVLLAGYFLLQQNNDCTQIGNTCVALEKANTPASRQQGLSGREGMSDQQGMVFIFDQPAEQCFWMKDMRFNLDMIWLNSSKEIVKIQSDVAPDTYPESFCASDAQYVVELNAGQSMLLGLKTGQQLQL